MTKKDFLRKCYSSRACWDVYLQPASLFWTLDRHCKGRLGYLTSKGIFSTSGCLLIQLFINHLEILLLNTSFRQDRWCY